MITRRSDQLTMFGELPPPEESLDQYFTDAKVASVFVEWTRLLNRTRYNKALTVLEPSCGEGAIVEALLKIGVKVIGVEIDAMRAEYVRSVYDIEVITGDFLNPEVFSQLEGRVHISVMNPPYSNGRDSEHVLQALKLTPQVFGLVRLPFLTTLGRYEQIWSKHRLDALAMLVRRPEWICPGEWGARTDYSFVEILKGEDGDVECVRDARSSTVSQECSIDWIQIE